MIGFDKYFQVFQFIAHICPNTIHKLTIQLKYIAYANTGSKMCRCKVVFASLPLCSIPGTQSSQMDLYDISDNQFKLKDGSQLLALSSHQFGYGIDLSYM